MFIHLNSTMANCSKYKDTITWEFSNLVLPNGGKLSLTGMNLDFTTTPSATTITSNLVRQNMFNQDGTIATLSSGKGVKYVRKYLHDPGQWMLDSMYPRFVSFTFTNVNIDTLSFASFTLMII